MIFKVLSLSLVVDSLSLKFFFIYNLMNQPVFLFCAIKSQQMTVVLPLSPAVGILLGPCCPYHATSETNLNMSVF